MAVGMYMCMNMGVGVSMGARWQRLQLGMVKAGVWIGRRVDGLELERVQHGAVACDVLPLLGGPRGHRRSPEAAAGLVGSGAVQMAERE